MWWRRIWAIQRSEPAIVAVEWQSGRRVIGDGWACQSGHEKPRSVRATQRLCVKDEPHPGRRHCAFTHRLHLHLRLRTTLHPATSPLSLLARAVSVVSQTSRRIRPFRDSKPRPAQLPRKNSQPSIAANCQPLDVCRPAH
ncbi:hypothetical protein IG631_14540 [Alternaria alternata]|nr:hypothetical protein IG631_14540 [Alternaria alternata]